MKKVKKEPKVAVLILTYNPFKEHTRFVEKMLKTFKKVNYGNYVVYVVENGSPKENVRDLPKKFPNVNFIFIEKNLGFSMGNNYGMRKIIKKENPDYLLLLNDDMEVNDKNFIKKMVKIGESDKRNGIIGCMDVFEDGSLQWYAKDGKVFFHKNKGIRDNSKKIFETQRVEQIVGCNLLIKREVIDKVGMFDDELSPVYGDETDLCLRTTKAGFYCVYVGNAKIIHLRDQTISKMNEFEVFYSRIKNSIRLEWLNFGFLRILKTTFIHLGACFFERSNNGYKISKSPFRRLYILGRAYFRNFSQLRQIIRLRKHRNNYRVYED